MKKINSEIMLPPEDAKLIAGIMMLMGKLQHRLGARISVRQAMAFFFFALNDIMGTPKQLNDLRFGTDDEMEKIPLRSIEIFFEKRLNWLRTEAINGREFKIRLTEAGLDVCEKAAFIVREPKLSEEVSL